MKIQFYKARSGNGGEELIVSTIARLTRELSRFSKQITTVEVHLSDDNGKMAGISDKRCVILVEVRGMPPISTIGHAGSYESVVNDAILKLKMLLHTTYGRLRVHLDQ